MDLTRIDALPIASLMPWLRPLWMVGVGAVVALLSLIVVYLLMWLVVPRTAAIARITAREAISQPVFWVVMAVAVCGLILFPFIPYNTFGDDIKVIKDTGLTWIMVWSIGVALWTASVSIAEELEGRTALTLLSKPIGRRSFVLGKFLGINLSVAVLFILLGALFLGTISYKKVYDSRESGESPPTQQECADEMEQILPGLALAYLETVVLTSICVAISTRLPIIPNLVICLSIYILGHLVPLVVNSSVGKLELVAFVGTFLSVILPVLDHFNVYGSIATGADVPWSYVGTAALYCVLYSTVAMLLGLLLFEDRDLA